jgi:hypothetical protein
MEFYMHKKEKTGFHWNILLQFHLTTHTTLLSYYLFHTNQNVILSCHKEQHYISWTIVLPKLHHSQLPRTPIKITSFSPRWKALAKFQTLSTITIGIKQPQNNLQKKQHPTHHHQLSKLCRVQILMIDGVISST